jgi:hypothetical protein
MQYTVLLPVLIDPAVDALVRDELLLRLQRQPVCDGFGCLGFSQCPAYCLVETTLLLYGLGCIVPIFQGLRMSLLCSIPSRVTVPDLAAYGCFVAINLCAYLGITLSYFRSVWIWYLCPRVSWR